MFNTHSEPINRGLYTAAVKSVRKEDASYLMFVTPASLSPGNLFPALRFLPRCDVVSLWSR